MVMSLSSRVRPRVPKGVSCVRASTTQSSMCVRVSCTHKSSSSSSSSSSSAVPVAVSLALRRLGLGLVSVCTPAIMASSLVNMVHPPAALAIPQTSICATEACDDNDYSGVDLAAKGEFFTKGSLKRAKFIKVKANGVNFFGADLTNADFTDADLSDANFGQANMSGVNLTNANLTNAIVSSARFENAIIDNTDWSDVIIRKDINNQLCEIAKGVNPKTGVDTRESLFCE